MIFLIKSIQVIFTFALITLAFSTTKYFPSTANQITLHGRYHIQNEFVKYDWSCFNIDFCFANATKVYWNVQDSWNIYHLILDQSKTTKIQPKNNKKILVFESSQPESHCLQIVKITQNHYGPLASYKDSVFMGIQLEKGVLIKKQRKYSYKFEFLGDSITTAFGVMSGRNPLCFLKMKQIQNCLQNWAVHLSTMFNADYRIEAVSGKGVMRNAFGVTGAKMPSLFTRLSDNQKYNSYKYQDDFIPSAYLLFIGSNDYSNIKNPSANNFVTAYKEMLREIISNEAKYTDHKSKIINVCDIEFNRQLCYNIQKAVRQFAYRYNQVYYVELPMGTLPKQNVGCVGHPNTKGQRKIAETIYEDVKKILES